MEAPDRILRRRAKRSRWCLLITCLMVGTVILAIIIPVAVVFSRRKNYHGLASTVLLPLYIYPNPGAWDPLFEVMAAHTGLSFTVVVNPEDGPGSSRYPSDDYISQVQKLNTLPNVQTVGYVRTHWATRNITSVIQEISTYSGWATFNATALAVQGIFFDEAPSEYSPATAEYMSNINQAAKTASGLQSDRMVIHNPGTIPDGRFNDPNTDVTVVLESTYSDYQSQQAQLAALAGDRSQYSYMVHSIPIRTNWRKLVDSMSQHAGYLFVTSLTQNYYESFGPQWKEFVDTLLPRTRIACQNIPIGLRLPIRALTAASHLINFLLRGLSPSSESGTRHFRYTMSRKSAVIVPLYIYPFPGVWDPLHDAITSHPNLHFVVIINPHDGPGAADFPDANYQREIPRLNACANVCTVGYVRIDYCKRAMQEVVRDIGTYAEWAKDYAKSGLGVQGIFFDEAHNLYSESVAAYLITIDKIAREMFGIQGDRLVIHNPGTIPDATLATPGPDVTAVFEASYAEYRSARTQERLLSLIPYKRHQCAYFVHSVPLQEVRQLVLELRHLGQYLFVTNLQEHFYVSFGPSWREFIEAMQIE